MPRRLPSPSRAMLVWTTARPMHNDTISTVRQMPVSCLTCRLLTGSGSGSGYERFGAVPGHSHLIIVNNGGNLNARDSEGTLSGHWQRHFTGRSTRCSTSNNLTTSAWNYFVRNRSESSCARSNQRLRVGFDNHTRQTGGKSNPREFPSSPLVQFGHDQMIVTVTVTNDGPKLRVDFFFVLVKLLVQHIDLTRSICSTTVSSSYHLHSPLWHLDSG